MAATTREQFILALDQGTTSSRAVPVPVRPDCSMVKVQFTWMAGDVARD